MRHLLFIVSGVWLLVRAVAFKATRAVDRTRHHAVPEPSPVHATPVRLVLPSATTGRPAPRLPDRPQLPWEKAGADRGRQTLVATASPHSQEGREW
ncbi:hypothetical protein NE857_32305 [Nocardiopsis exhalans]|uniref:Uncharacterized protein n=3 Tax=Nocardiopsis TaxID=2013 RepID=A0A840WP75_9ACTN|nr:MULTISPECIES: hypothetical protein [Nocardiopsis]MBB5493407.1 hypothetical protein [Nocardiopsis metallicus]MCK9873024.1 hypothetical protein [Nocardiopsis dassonvillei]MEE2051620.1 hypothetical protein [Nocardiopsis umidischolae]USY19858.1 hypothetical protein NE857_32305 [Nocardiopsis exhalans]